MNHYSAMQNFKVSCRKIITCYKSNLIFCKELLKMQFNYDTVNYFIDVI